MICVPTDRAACVPEIMNKQLLICDKKNLVSSAFMEAM
jgi:hypothetical protein